MIDHVSIGVADLARSETFYTALGFVKFELASPL